jgi:hypothetical protein
MILETNSGRGINMMQIVGKLYFVIVGSPGEVSVEELLSQLSKDVMGLGLTRRIQEGASSLPSAFHLQGGRHRVPAVMSL